MKHARAVLCGGCWVTGIPTAAAIQRKCNPQPDVLLPLELERRRRDEN